MATAAGRRKALAMVDKSASEDSNARDTASDICRLSFSMSH